MEYEVKQRQNEAQQQLSYQIGFVCIVCASHFVIISLICDPLPCVDFTESECMPVCFFLGFYFSHADL